MWTIAVLSKLEVLNIHDQQTVKTAMRYVRLISITWVEYYV